MLSPRFLRLYADKCRRSAQSMDDRRSVAEFQAMALDLEDWANDAAGRTIHAARPALQLAPPRRLPTSNRGGKLSRSSAITTA